MGRVQDLCRVLLMLEGLDCRWQAFLQQTTVVHHIMPVHLATWETNCLQFDAIGNLRDSVHMRSSTELRWVNLPVLVKRRAAPSDPRKVPDKVEHVKALGGGANFPKGIDSI